jgi:hypothetical protein
MPKGQVKRVGLLRPKSQVKRVGLLRPKSQVKRVGLLSVTRRGQHHFAPWSTNFAAMETRSAILI